MNQLIKPGEEFGQLFAGFQHTAFRLEVRSRYNPAYERESLQKFLAGEPDDLSWMQDWLRMVREATAVGRRFARVRVVDLPLSDYNAFSLAVSAHNNAAGEDIRYLRREDAVGLPGHDYWLFDSSKLVWMHFGEDDRFTHAELIDDPAIIVQHNYWRDAAWHKAVGRDDFANQQHIGRV